MRRGFAVLIATTTLALGAVVGVALAAPAGASTTPCWTSFNPPAPQGHGMTQTYRNCNGYTLSVMPYYRNAGGSYYTFDGSCKSVANGAVATWKFSRTEPGVNYGTAVCNPPSPPFNQRVYFGVRDDGKCWTNSSLAGTEDLAVWYADCSYSSPTVAPAYVSSTGSLYGYNGSCLKLSPPPANQVGVAAWNFNYTNASLGNFTVVFCAGKVT